jgi:ribonuclease J
MGISAENVLLMKNGKVLELNEKEAKFTTSVTSGNVMVDGLGVGDVGNIVLRDRQHLSQDGLIIVTVTMDSKGKVVAGPDVISRGFVYVRESENLMEEVKNLVNVELMRCEDNHITDWSTIKNSIRDVLKDYVLETTKRNPMILPIIEELKK